MDGWRDCARKLREWDCCEHFCQGCFWFSSPALANYGWVGEKQVHLLLKGLYIWHGYSLQFGYVRQYPTCGGQKVEQVHHRLDGR